MKILALALLLVAGCSTPRLELEQRWRPLKRVEQDPTRLQAAGFTTTIGATCYCADLAAWERTYPAGSVAREAILSHELVHAQRQSATGLGLWLARYLAERSFKWAEEKLGWREEIATKVRGFVYVDENAAALTLSRDYGGMVGFDEALAFVRQAIADAEGGPR